MQNHHGINQDAHLIDSVLLQILNPMYPTNEQLENIADWPLNDRRGLLEYMQELWNKDYGKIEINDNEYRFITGGWSGNEDIIDSAYENSFFWIDCWEKSERGGLHVFKLKATS